LIHHLSRPYARPDPNCAPSHSVRTAYAFACSAKEIGGFAPPLENPVFGDDRLRGIKLVKNLPEQSEILLSTCAYNRNPRYRKANALTEVVLTPQRHYGTIVA